MAENELVLPDNSHAARKERKELEKKEPKRVEKVVHGKVTTKKNDMRRLSDMFISEDAANVKNYIIMDVVVPAIKRALYDGVANSLDMILFGGRGGSTKRSSADSVSYRNYNAISRDRNRNERSNRSNVNTSRSYDDIIFDSRADAKDVLDRMDELMEQYESVSIADMFDLAGLSAEYTDNKYGWTDIRNAEIVSTREGYKIKMPRAVAFR